MTSNDDAHWEAWYIRGTISVDAAGQQLQSHDRVAGTEGEHEQMQALQRSPMSSTSDISLSPNDSPQLSSTTSTLRDFSLPDTLSRIEQEYSALRHLHPDAQRSNASRTCSYASSPVYSRQPSPHPFPAIPDRPSWLDADYQQMMASRLYGERREDSTGRDYSVRSETTPTSKDSTPWPTVPSGLGPLPYVGESMEAFLDRLRQDNKPLFDADKRWWRCEGQWCPHIGERWLAYLDRMEGPNGPGAARIRETRLRWTLLEEPYQPMQGEEREAYGQRMSFVRKAACNAEDSTRWENLEGKLRPKTEETRTEYQARIRREYGEAVLTAEIEERWESHMEKVWGRPCNCIA